MPVEDTTQRIDAPLLLERYRPTRLLARGGSSRVFQGHDETLGRDVAIKLFNSSTGLDLEAQRAELRVLAGLRHHGVVAVIDAGIDQSTPEDPRAFLVMELVRGKTLWNTMRARRLSMREVGEIGFEIAEVLEYIHHRGVTHRDVTPANIMLVEYGTGASRPRARLTDFGIAIHAASAPLDEDSVTGTLGYLSPEQLAGDPLTPATDIYSLGISLIEAAVRARVFTHPDDTPVDDLVGRTVKVPKGIPEPLREVLRRMTRRDPSKRPTAAELLTDLRVALRAIGD